MYRNAPLRTVLEDRKHVRVHEHVCVRRIGSPISSLRSSDAHDGIDNPCDSPGPV